MNLEIEVSWKIWFKIDSVKDTLLCDSFSITIEEDIHLRQKRQNSRGDTMQQGGGGAEITLPQGVGYLGWGVAEAS